MAFIFLNEKSIPLRICTGSTGVKCRREKIQKNAPWPEMSISDHYFHSDGYRKFATLCPPGSMSLPSTHAEPFGLLSDFRRAEACEGGSHIRALDFLKPHPLPPLWTVHSQLFAPLCTISRIILRGLFKGLQKQGSKLNLFPSNSL